MNTQRRSTTTSGRPVLVIVAASTLALAGSAGAASQESTRGQQQAQSSSAEQAIQEWPSASSETAQKMIQRYGEPDAVTESMLVWQDNGPWVRTIVHKEPVQHNFPVPHEDVLEQVIAYEVPEDKFSDLAKYDGSVVAYRTNGELAARCGQEAANFLALNLAHDIIEGERSVEEARSFYADTIRKMMQGEEPEYAQALQFETRTAAATADPDEQVLQVAASGQRETGGASSAQGTQGESIASMLNSELAGKSVLSADGEVIGDIAEIQADEQGRHVARIEVDGFLGLGQDELTVPISELTLTSGGEVRTSMTKDELESQQKSGQENRDRGKERDRM